MNLIRACAVAAVSLVAFVVYVQVDKLRKAEAAAAAEAIRPRDVVVSVTPEGVAGRGMVTIAVAGQSTQHVVDLPWQMTLRVVPGLVVVASVQNRLDYGGVGLAIKSGGRILASTASSGGYVIAQTSAACCD